MSASKTWPGQTKGEWLVIGNRGYLGKKPVWLIQHTCGYQQLIRVDKLNTSPPKRCKGCFIPAPKPKRQRTRRYKPTGNPIGRPSKHLSTATCWTQLFKAFEKDVGKTSRTSTLTLTEYILLSTSVCHYCGGISEYKSPHGLDCVIKTTGIDRVDNSQGYTLANCVPCCWNCNRFKGSMSEADFLAHNIRITLYQLFISGQRIVL